MSIKTPEILVVGDIMLDHYIICDVNRISPEAPVPVALAKDDSYVLGGCGVVIRNLVEFGVSVTCISEWGYDEAGRKIELNLNRYNCNHINLNSVYSNKNTTQKIRVIGGEGSTQMIRIDRENVSPNPLSKEAYNYILAITKPDIIVVSDYGKGVVTQQLMDILHVIDSPMIIDPYPEHLGRYGKVFMITPNQKEWDKMTSTSLVENNFKNILITKGKEGMELSRRIGENTKDSETWHTVFIRDEPVPVYNVSGAGDAVVAVMATCIAEGVDIETSARIANKCAGYVVTQPGTSIVPKKLFLETLKYYGQKAND